MEGVGGRKFLPASQSEWIFSGIFDKIGSSKIINILKILNSFNGGIKI